MALWLFLFVGVLGYAVWAIVLARKQRRSRREIDAFLGTERRVKLLRFRERGR